MAKDMGKRRRTNKRRQPLPFSFHEMFLLQFAYLHLCACAPRRKVAHWFPLLGHPKKQIPVVRVYLQGGKWWVDAMPTALELRLQAKECLELAEASKEFYVKAALTDLARKLCRDARQAEPKPSSNNSSPPKQDDE
jgi:hypothetical protein